MTSDGYNPHFPTIMGNEWVPIREENLQYNQVINNVELGYSFSSAGQRIAEARFYVNTLPPALIRNQVWTANIYPRGAENQSGPIGSVVIPCNSGAIAGAGVALSTAASVQDALEDASDRRFINVALGNSATCDVTMYFGVNQYLNLLVGKRILGVNFLYAAELIAEAADDLGQRLSFALTMQNGATQDILTYPPVFSGNSPSIAIPSPFQPGVINRIALGDTNVAYPTLAGVNTVTGVPWTLSQLQRFEVTDANALHMQLHSIALAGVGPIYSLDYAAMEIIYCEEARLGFGCGLYGTGNSSVTRQYQYGANPIPLVDINLSSDIPLPAAGVTVTLAQGNLGDSIAAFTVNRIGPQPTLNALRELYSVPAYPGVQVNIPAPATPDIDGQVFTTEQTSVIPQLTLHRAGSVGLYGPIPFIHVYGRQAVSQVYGTVTAKQYIWDQGTTSAPFPDVRFYARRFGDTSVPLTLSSPTISGAGLSVSITPQEWDALDPIIDGWKEINLVFPTAPTMGTGTNPQWVWSAAGETAGNRWEVLGANAPAVSGIIGNPQNLVPAYDQLVLDTYGQPASGGVIDLSWMPWTTPFVSATTEDRTSDAVVLFSQLPRPVTGFGITQQNQALSGIGLQCGILGLQAPPFIPTALQYNQLTWGYDLTTTAYDTFTRVAASSWGTATSGQIWATTGGSATDYSVSGGTGNVFVDSTTTRLTNLGGPQYQNIDVYCEVSANALGSWVAGPTLRTFNSGDDGIHVRVAISATDQTVTLSIISYTATVGGLLATKIVGFPYVPGAKIKIRAQAFGYSINAKAWRETDAEPAEWQAFAVRLVNNSPGFVGTRTQGSGLATNKTVSYDNFHVTETNYGYTELQRQDDLTGWQTIMKATNDTVLTFNDYEARTALRTDYRIRRVNSQRFEGAWSSTVSNTIPAPGVTATSLGANDHVFIFTTNSTQSGASNLAYALGWEGEVSEDFSFPESAGQAFQAMYGRDYVTAFRPRERGGTNFTRTILVQAAAIPPETLEDFTSLRNMAWADVPYICLRDEDGNRWFTNISVPSGTVLLSRRLYLAPVSVVEVTDTPTPVNP